MGPTAVQTGQGAFATAVETTAAGVFTTQGMLPPPIQLCDSGPSGPALAEAGDS